MNPEERAAREAMMARLAGTPQPAISQQSPQSPVPAPAPQVVAQDPQPQPQQQLGDMTRKASPHEKLIKSLLPATSDSYDPQVQGISKALLTKLIPYL